MEEKIIILKQEDKTDKIKKIERQDNYYLVTFNNGKQFKYKIENVQILDNPINIPVDDIKISFANKPLHHIVKVLKFNGWYKIFYGKENKSICYRDYQLEIEESCLKDNEIKSCFEYFKSVARITGIVKNGKNILLNKYNNIHFISKETLAAMYFDSKLKNNTQKPNLIIYPFGFNESQKKAVERALSNSLSVIEGPPGTGKTQTILNILSNNIICDRTSAVVSNNGYAVDNVFDKMEKQGLEFLIARLGRSSKKEDFLENQPAIPDLTSWVLSEDEENSLANTLLKLEQELDLCLKKRAKLYEDKGLLEKIKVEYEYYLSYYEKANYKLNVKFPKLSANKIMLLWVEFETYNERNKKISIIKKIMNIFKFHLYNFTFYNIDYEILIPFLQNEFYRRKIKELESSIQKLERILENYDFQKKMNEYTDMSMKYLKNFIAEKYKKSFRKIYSKKDLNSNPKEFMQDYPIVLSTTYSIITSLPSSWVYDYVIMDEASQINIETGVLALICANNAVVVGDLKQLPNIVDKKHMHSLKQLFHSYNLIEGYDCGKYSMLASILKIFPTVERTLLREHYRCHYKIIDFCNQKFYDGKLIIMSDVKTDRKPLAIYVLPEGQFARKYETSKGSQRQADVIIEEIVKQQNLDLNKDSIGIITPYRAQEKILNFTVFGKTVQASTVDKFQGQERNIIIISTVDNEITKFTDDANRLNVAISRAKEQLILIINGNEKRYGQNIDDFVNYIKYNNGDFKKSQLRSIFDYLYKQYTEEKMKFLAKYSSDLKFDSEKLYYNLLRDIFEEEERFNILDIRYHVRLKEVLNNFDILTDEERKYANYGGTHLDFAIFNKVTKQIFLAIEVDGDKYHNQFEEKNQEQVERDKKKNSILERNNIPYLRFSTVGYGDREKTIEKLDELLEKYYDDKQEFC